MAARKKKETLTQKYAKKAKKSRTTAKDVPGSGLAKRAGKALQNRKTRLEKMMKDI